MIADTIDNPTADGPLELTFAKHVLDGIARWNMRSAPPLLASCRPLRAWFKVGCHSGHTSPKLKRGELQPSLTLRASMMGLTTPKTCYQST